MAFKTEISIVIDDDSWKIEPYENLIKNAIKAAIKETKINIIDDIEISILLTNDKAQRILNKQFRKINKSTNVLSFPSLVPFSDVFGLVGDISLAFEIIKKEAKELEISFKDHLTHLIVHGFLHLLGYDHKKNKQALVMESLEIKILKKLDIKNPY